ncbi:MAG: hypothetical protein U9Q35_10395 [Pseudomonadota bacterium]|uniref:hypothetical protein n=1 Tax=Halomonas sp. IOP_31 TaxID=2876584 RepID=UPI001E4D961A|nr:hypothetical protein [Halomonas sp. IOP_31]MCD6008460.1 hypothetical protein [Halomonas sp. IOP_31]MEA3251957.1 hypothetical protein [Pseudomonadota bacterium]
MRDLYKRLGVEPSADDASIGAAIDACDNSALKADAAAVLRVGARREAYDGLHGMLSELGRLRARLGLTHGAHWRGDVANDFSLTPDLAQSRHDQLVAKLDAAVAGQARLARWRRLMPWLIIAGFSLIAAGGFAAGRWLG